MPRPLSQSFIFLHKGLKINTILGLLYYVSHLWWAQMESGTMKALRLNLDNPSLNNAEQDKKLTELKNYFIKYRGRHRLYGLQYFYVIIFNALHVMLDIIITHFILNRLSFTNTGVAKVGGPMPPLVLLPLKYSRV